MTAFTKLYSDRRISVDPAKMMFAELARKGRSFDPLHHWRGKGKGGARNLLTDPVYELTLIFHQHFLTVDAFLEHHKEGIESFT